MSAVFHLIRHGSHAELGAVLSGRSDIGLNASGRAQAAALALRLREEPIRAIVASPRRRAIETAEAIAAGHPVRIDDAFDEIDFGRWTGRRFAELAADPGWTRWNEARALALPPEGESMADATARAVARIEALAEQEEGLVAIVTHCDIIRGVIAHYLGLSLDRLLAFDIDPASISTISVGDWGGRITALNGRAA